LRKCSLVQAGRCMRNRKKCPPQRGIGHYSHTKMWLERPPIRERYSSGSRFPSVTWPARSPPAPSQKSPMGRGRAFAELEAGRFTVMMRIVLISLLLCAPALAHDPSHPELNEWFNRLASGKGLCCSFADGLAVSDVDWESKDGHYPRPSRGPMDRRSRRCRNQRAKPCRQNYGLALHGRTRDRSSVY